MTSSGGQVGYMPQAIGPSPYPQKTCCENGRIGLASGNLLPVHSHLYKLCDWLFSQGLSTEPTMDGTSGFPDMPSSSSRSPFISVPQQRHIEACFRYLFHTHALIHLKSTSNAMGTFGSSF